MSIVRLLELGPYTGQHNILLQAASRSGLRRTSILYELPDRTQVLIEVPDDLLIERACNRRIDPTTGEIYHLKPKRGSIMLYAYHGEGWASSRKGSAATVGPPHLPTKT